MGIEHLWEFRSRLVVSGLGVVFRALLKHPFRDADEHAKWPSGVQQLLLGEFLSVVNWVLEFQIKIYLMKEMICSYHN